MNFTYRIKWSKTGLSYYGVRYKDGIDETSLMTTYFTSSKYVKQYIKENGLPDIVQIRKKFSDKLSAKRWEERVIDKGRLYSNPAWLNIGNNGSFRGVVMNTEMIQKIKDGRAKGDKTKRQAYNNGSINKQFKDGESIPEGFVLGKLLSKKQLKYLSEMSQHVRARDPIKVQEARVKQSKSTKGKKKPDGFGKKISKAIKGKSKPYMAGDNNPSKTLESRNKISKSWETREKGKWFTNKETKEKKWIYLKDIQDLDLKIWENKREPLGAWYTDGANKLWKKCGEDLTGLIKIGVRTKLK